MTDAVIMPDAFDRTFPVSRGRRTVVAWVLAALVSVAAFLMLAKPYLSTETVLGDLGDARFNLYILEHTFRYLTGLDASYQSPEMFYPFPGALLFSDTHVGSVPFYVLFRSLGVAPFTAFTWWIFVGYLLTFWAGYYAFLRFGFAPLPAVVAAVVFSFSLPSLAQVGHAQLTYRVGIPLAFLSLWNLARCGLVRDACWLVIWTGYEFLCSVYLGVFLLLSLTVFAGWTLFVNRDVCPPSLLLSKIVADARRFSTTEAMRLTAMAAVVAAVVVLLHAHYSWAAMYGLGRKWSELSTMVPRPQSYFRMDILPYWNVIYTTFVDIGVPMAHEHNLFMGVGALVLLMVGTAAIVSGGVPSDFRRLSKAGVLTLACLVVLVTKFGNFNLYYYISALPGLNAIRAVSRVGIVMAFPAALVVAVGVGVMLGSRPRLPGAVLLGLLVTTIAAEIVMLQRSSFPIADANIRVEAIVDNARARSVGIEKPILFVNEGSESGYKIHLDAMFAAQRLGWPTVNGYSSVGVPGSDNHPDCGTPARQIEAYLGWHLAQKSGPDLGPKAYLNRLVMSVWPDCGIGRTTNIDGMGPEPGAEIARHISLIPLSLEQRQSRVVFGISIRNDGDNRLVSNSFRPIRVSWRFVEVGSKVEKGVGWDPRFQLTRDVLPHGSANVILTADLPRKPGEYRLQVSLVSELAYWFHDEGMGILQFEPVLTIPKSG